MVEKEDSVIVPISKKGFEFTKRLGHYVFPVGQMRNVHYLFFYQTKPVKAITCYSKVIKYLKNAEHLISIYDKIYFFPDPTKQVSALKIGKIIKLKKQIPNIKNKQNIQSKVYFSFKDIMKSVNISDIFSKKQAKTKET